MQTVYFVSPKISLNRVARRANGRASSTESNLHIGVDMND